MQPLSYNALTLHFIARHIFLMCLSILFLASCMRFHVTTAKEMACEGKEAMALFRWKSSLDNQSQALLSSWDGKNPCSNWVGVGYRRGSVSHLNLSSYGLRERFRNKWYQELSGLFFGQN
ncbi:hypothetical protein RJ640_024238 [Escallonia rubra]|uniref:Leucine-rich repeat-containing N-terminal plant-type domain-containing protein n=1 Tax=Escallonia rubra TaxID=112253 RepID=A0AA88U0Y7_9ASTE|nr:hypothetical protein RJ640_024238 [Escallonia rubra]